MAVSTLQGYPIQILYPKGNTQLMGGYHPGEIGSFPVPLTSLAPSLPKGYLVSMTVRFMIVEDTLGLTFSQFMIKHQQSECATFWIDKEKLKE